MIELAGISADDDQFGARHVRSFERRGYHTVALHPYVIFGERHRRHLIEEFVEHYHTERFHQGLGGQLIKRPHPA